MLLGTKFGEDTSNSSLDIEWKPASHVTALNDLCDLENKVNVTPFELGLCLALVLPCTEFGEDTSNISSDNELKPSFMCC